MSTLADLKKKSFNAKNLREEADKGRTKFYRMSEDPRFWKPTADKAGNASATIRYLPAPAVDGEEGIPFIKIFHHSFKGPGGWYIENCLSTFNDPDPCNDMNLVMLRSKDDDQVDFVKKHSRRREKYIAGILVVKDKANPANDGQVFLYEFGKQVMDKVEDQFDPKFEEDEACNPFDPFDGKNFNIRVSLNQNDLPDYKESKFDEATSPISEDEDEIVEIWNKSHSLMEFLNREDKRYWRTHADLQKSLDRVMGKRQDMSDTVNETTDSTETVAQKAAKTTPIPAVKKNLKTVETDDDIKTVALVSKKTEPEADVKTPKKAAAKVEKKPEPVKTPKKAAAKVEEEEEENDEDVTAMFAALAAED